MAPYRRPTRIFTPVLDARFPLDLSAYLAELTAGEFKSLSLEAMVVHAPHAKAREVQLPRDMRSFSKMALKTPVAGLEPKGEAQAFYLIGGFCVDVPARDLAGVVSDVTLALRYDATTMTVEGSYQFHSGRGESPSPAGEGYGLSLSFCAQYYPAGT